MQTLVVLFIPICPVGNLVEAATRLVAAAIIRGVDSRGGPRVADPNAGPGQKTLNFFRKNFKLLQFLGHFREKIGTFPVKKSDDLF